MNVVLKKSYFKEVPVAKKGDRVLLVAGYGAVRIATPGLLREDGYIGVPVRAVNLMSKKEVTGWLTDSGTVKIEF